MTWTEAKIQNHLATVFNRKGCVCVPNCGVFGWEADLVRVTPRLFSAEYEAKISRADFRADKKKQWRQICLEEADKRRLAGRPVPNYFWYAAPPGIVPLDEVPEFAGLVELIGPGYLDVRKTAPRLHKQPMRTRDVLFLTRGAALRYWQQRASVVELVKEGE